MMKTAINYIHITFPSDNMFSEAIISGKKIRMIKFISKNINSSFDYKILNKIYFHNLNFISIKAIKLLFKKQLKYYRRKKLDINEYLKIFNYNHPAYNSQLYDALNF